MKKNVYIRFTVIVGLFFGFLSLDAHADVTFQGSAAGTFTNPAGPSGMVTTSVGTNNFTWGIAYPDVSWLTFTGKSFNVTTPTGYILGSTAQDTRPYFTLGTLDYHNGTIQADSQADSVLLDTNIQLTLPVATGPSVVSSQLNLINSPNIYNDPIASADYVYLPQSLPPVTLTTVGGLPITVQPAGFGNASTGGFTQVDKFFVLEGESASADLFARIVSPGETIVHNAVTISVVNNTMMQASFTPNFGLTLNDAAKLTGYDHFDWYQVITNWPNPDLFAKSNSTKPLTTPPSFVDPPLGGYTYQPNGDDFLPFYWNAQELQQNTTATTLSFLDIPADPMLHPLAPDQFLGFTTFLVGVLPDYTWDALFSWHWISIFNGTVGGVSVTKNINFVDPGSGTGGVSILDTDLTAEDIPQNVRELMQRDGARNVNLPSNPVPEPSTIVLLFSGLSLLAMRKLCVGKA